jgi:hypothetical protein
VEQPATGRLEGMEPPAEVDDDSTTEMAWDHMADVKEECELGGTSVEYP